MSSGLGLGVPSQGRVRVVGKVQAFDEPNQEGQESWVSVSKSDRDFASITFTDQAASRRESYKLDWCYGQLENASDIFSKEIKPLLGVILSGSNACVIAYGARGSGKTKLIQGSEESPGLAPMAVSEILSSAEEIGASVAVSYYEVIQDHVYDVLEPKENEVLVFEDAGGKIRLKGLSQVPVKSVSDFNKILGQGNIPRKPPLKAIDETTFRSHIGMIVNVSYLKEGARHPLVGKLAFVDLTGYEVIKQKGKDRHLFAESTKINKSLYTLLNVVYAQNSNEARIPYRESKLTRLLQEFICRTSVAVLITCMKPTICQDTLHAVSLASRSCQVVNQNRIDPSKKAKTGQRFMPQCSPCNSGLPSGGASIKRTPYMCSIDRKGNITPSSTKGRCQPLSASVKKCVNQKLGVVKNKSATPAVATAKKLFSNLTPLTDSNKMSMQENIPVSADMKISESEEGNCSSNNTNAPESLEPEVQDIYPAVEQTQSQDNEHDCVDSKYHETDTESMSHSVSKRLREVLNLLSPQPQSKHTPSTMDMSSIGTVGKNHENHADPRTPVVPFCTRLYDDQCFLSTCTPKDALKTWSTGLKKSLAQECLTFLNSASKEELKALKGIGEKRATHILELREENTEPFKEISDIHKHLGLSSKQINGMMTKVFEESTFGNQTTPTKFMMCDN